MSTSAESLDDSAEITFIRDASRPGFAHIRAILFNEEDDAKVVPLGTYRIRDLIIALHAIAVDEDAA